MDGLAIIADVYRRLKKPSQEALPHQTVLEAVREAVAQKKLDLALSPQNGLGLTSAWFTPDATDSVIDDLVDDADNPVLLPIRLERRAVGSTYEKGDDVPIVNYEVLNTSTNGAVSFYADPMRLVFSDVLDYVTQQEYRLIYEPDFPAEFARDTETGLPNYFRSLVALEAAYDLLDMVEDTTPEWEQYVDRMSAKWPGMIADKREAWKQYVRTFKGRARVPKRTFFGNRGCRNTLIIR